MRKVSELIAFGVLIGSMAGPASAQSLLSPELRQSIKDDDAIVLPRNATLWERGIRVEAARQPAAPPSGPVRAQAEYERNDGLLVRWGSLNAVLTEIAVAVTTLDSSARMMIVVSGASQQSSASATLLGAGANLSRIDFIVAASNSVWMRDYGPRFVDDSGDRAIVDHTYNRPRPNDNLIPGVIAGAWNRPLYLIPLVHGGGNFHLFGNRQAFMTQLILNENPGLSEQQIKDLYLTYQGLDLTVVPAFPTSFDATQHIDMWMLPVDDDEVIISQYDASTGIPQQVSDSTAQLMQQRGFTVFRTPGWSAGGAHYTYANSIVINDLVLVCSFSGQTARNEQARATYAAAFEDHQIVQIDCSSIITLAGAIHCIVMHVPSIAATPLFRDGFE